MWASEANPFKGNDWKRHSELWLTPQMKETRPDNTRKIRETLQSGRDLNKELFRLIIHGEISESHGHWCIKDYRRYYPKEQSSNTGLLKRTAERPDDSENVYDCEHPGRKMTKYFQSRGLQSWVKKKRCGLKTGCDWFWNSHWRFSNYKTEKKGTYIYEHHFLASSKRPSRKHFIQLCTERIKTEVFCRAPLFNTVRGREKTTVA